MSSVWNSSCFLLTGMIFLRFQAALVAVEVVRIEHALHQLIGTGPVIGSVGMPLGDERRTGVEHLVLLVTRAELRTDGIPSELVELHSVMRIGRRRLLRLGDAGGDLRIGEISRR